ncbi:MAG: TRAP transporter large permease subunit [Actinomycetaceae bacterium]
MSAENLFALACVLVVFLALLAIRFHVGLPLMLAGMVGIVMLRTTDAAVSTVASQPFSASADCSLTIIPLFMLMGVFAVHGRLAAAGFDGASRMLGRFPAGSSAGDGSTPRDTSVGRPDRAGVAYLAVIFLVSIGTIYAGVATPTEAASFGAMTALIILLIRTRPPRWMVVLKESVTEAVGLTAMTFLLMAGAGVFTYFLALSGASSALVDAVVSADLPPYLVLVLCLLILLPLGMFLDGVSMILVAAPLLHPILTEYGFDGIWLGILVVKVAEMALITPPVGMNAFVYSGSVPEAGLGRVFRGIVPFIIADVVVVAILVLVPEIVTFLPDMGNA